MNTQGSSESFQQRFKGRVNLRNADGTTAPAAVSVSSTNAGRPRKGQSNGATRPHANAGAVANPPAQAALTSSRPRKGQSNGAVRPPPSNGATNRDSGDDGGEGSLSPARRIQQKTNSIFKNLHAGLGPDPLGGLPDGADGGYV